ASPSSPACCSRCRCSSARSTASPPRRSATCSRCSTPCSAFRCGAARLPLPPSASPPERRSHGQEEAEETAATEVPQRGPERAPRIDDAAGAAGTALVGAFLAKQNWQPKTIAGVLTAVGTAVAWTGKTPTLQSIGAGTMAAGGGQLALQVMDDRY